MPKCCVKQCKNNTIHLRKEHGISYFRFPQNDIQREKWRLIIKKERNDDKFKPNDSSVVCSDHFAESDMYYTQKGFRKISKNALPKIKIQSTLRVDMEQSYKIKSEENSDTDVDSLSKPEPSTNGNKSFLPKVTNVIADVSQVSATVPGGTSQATSSSSTHFMDGIQEESLSSISSGQSSILNTKQIFYKKVIRNYKQKLQLKSSMVQNLKKQNMRLVKKNTKLKQLIKTLKIKLKRASSS